jgi:Fe-S cluster biogenesis protein NfuA
MTDATTRATRQRELAELMEVLDHAVAADGGSIRLVGADYDDGIVELELSGACSACAVASVTLEDGVERIMRQRLDWVRTIRHGVATSADLAADTARGRGGFVARH